jgi:hypothetical protein
MNRQQRITAAAALGVAAVLGLSACGINSGGSAPVGSVYKRPATVIPFPDGAANVARVCEGHEGIYSGEDHGGLFVLAHDPACK